MRPRPPAQARAGERRPDSGPRDARTGGAQMDALSAAHEPGQPAGLVGAVAFDVNETLTDLSALRGLFSTLGFDRTALDWWFAVLLRDGMALAAAGDHGGFAQLAGAALQEIAAAQALPLPPDAVDALLAAFPELPLHADVRPALQALRRAGIPALALTNGGAAVAEQIMRHGGVRELFTDVLSVDAVQRWKPSREPYEHAARLARLPVERVALVAVHPWDINGAAAAGMPTGWVNRGRVAYPAPFRPPTVQARSLDDVVAALLSA